MKYFVFISLYFLCQLALGQDKPETYNYKLLQKTVVTECNFSGDNKSTTSLLAPDQAVISVINFTHKEGTEQYLIVQFWPWPVSNSYSKLYNQKFFLMKKSDFDINTIPYYATWTKPSVFSVSTMTVPIKVRPSPYLDFQSNISVGAVFGVSYRISHKYPYYLNPVIGLALTSVPLDSASTKGLVRKSVDRPALSPLFGIVLDFNSTNIGFYSGIDLLSKKNRDAWVYHGKPWIGFGIGISLNSKKNDNLEQGKNTVKSN